MLHTTTRAHVPTMKEKEEHETHKQMYSLKSKIHNKRKEEHEMKTDIERRRKEEYESLTGKTLR